MTDWPESVLEYEELKERYKNPQSIAVYVYSDAAIRDLKAMVREDQEAIAAINKHRAKAIERYEQAEMNYDTAKSGWLGEVQRREQAEADARGWADSYKMAEQSIVELQAEVERLKWMLEQAWRKSGQAWNWPKDQYLADLAARWEERNK